MRNCADRRDQQRDVPPSWGSALRTGERQKQSGKYEANIHVEAAENRDGKDQVRCEECQRRPSPDIAEQCRAVHPDEREKGKSERREEKRRLARGKNVERRREMCNLLLDGAKLEGTGGSRDGR